MHVRRPANRRRITQFGRDESKHGRDIAPRFPIAQCRAELRKDWRSPQRAPPRAKVRRAEADVERRMQVPCDVARPEGGPAAVLRIAKETRAGRSQVARHEPREIAIGDDLALSNGPLADVREHGPSTLHAHMSLPQRRNAERPILLGISLTADTEEALADETHDRGRGSAPSAGRRCGIRAHLFANGGQPLRELAHPVVFAQLSTLHGARVVAILLAALPIHPPRLHLVRGGRSDMDVGPARRNHERPDAPECTGVAHQAAVRPLIAKRSLRARSTNPLSHARRPEGQNGGRIHRFRDRRPPPCTPSMADSLLTFDVSDRIATITLQRPETLTARHDAVMAALAAT